MVSTFAPLQFKSARTTSSTRKHPSVLRSRRGIESPKGSPAAEPEASPDRQHAVDFSFARVPIDAPVKAPGNTFEERRRDDTGLPDELKAGIESLSGVALDDVKVHYHSAIPAKMQARAFTQGTDIHVGPGEEKHLAHEAWHVVQQKQGRVNTPPHAKGPVITDNEELEREADTMGARALHSQPALPRATYHASSLPTPALTGVPGTTPIQPKWIRRADGSEEEVDDDYELQEDEEDIPDPVTQSSSKGVGKGTQLRLIGHAEKDKGEPKLALPTVFEKVGTDALDSGTLDTAAYRTYTSQFQPGHGGSGWDETFRTSLVRDTVKNLPTQDQEKFVKTVSRQREQTKDLFWLTGDPKQPLAGHPGALSKDVTNFSKGITKGHNSKDVLRAKWTEHQFEQGEKTGLDPKTSEALLMSDILTTSLMSQPYAQLSQATPSTSTTQAFNPVYGGIYDLSTGTLSEEGEKAMSDSHYARESRKWRTAEGLNKRGYHNLYPQVMKDKLEKHGGWAPAFEAFNRDKRSQQKFKDEGPPQSEAYIPTKTDAPMTLKGWDDTLGGTNPAQLGRAVSNPRELVELSKTSSAPTSTSSKKRQRVINEFFTPEPKKKKDDDLLS